MATTRIDADGNLYRLDLSGRWRPVTPAEQAALETSPVQAFLAQLPRTALDMRDLGTAGIGLATGTPPMTQDAMRRLAEREAQFAPLDELRPGPSGGGQFLLDPVDLLTAGGVTGAAVLGQRYLRGQLQRRVQQTIRGAAARVGGMADNATRAAGDRLAARSVGAAENTGGGLLDEVTRLANEFTTPMELTDAQRAAIPTMRRIGFQELPGQLSGSRLMLEGIKSNPVLRQAVEAELVANREGLERAFKAALGVPDATPFTDDILNVAEDVIGGRFDAVRDSITAPVRLSEAAQEIADPALSAYQRRAINLADGLPADQIMEVRSRLNQTSRDLFRKGEYTAGMDVVQAIDEIDDAIGQQIGEAGQALWRQAREQWKLLKLLESGQVIGMTGELNIRSANTAAKKLFTRAYRGFPEAGRAGLLPETSQALDWLKVSATFADNVGTSGTSERMAAMRLLTNPREYAKAKIVERLIRAQADRLNVPPAP